MSTKAATFSVIEEVVNALESAQSLSRRSEIARNALVDILVGRIVANERDVTILTALLQSYDAQLSVKARYDSNPNP